MEPEIVLLRGIFPLWQSEYFIEIILLRKKKKSIWEDRELLIATLLVIFCFVDSIFSYVEFEYSKDVYEKCLEHLRQGW